MGTSVCGILDELDEFLTLHSRKHTAYRRFREAMVLGDRALVQRCAVEERNEDSELREGEVPNGAERLLCRPAHETGELMDPGANIFCEGVRHTEK